MNAVKEKFGISDAILAFTNGQVYLNYDVLAKKGTDRKIMASSIADILSRGADHGEGIPMMRISLWFGWGMASGRAKPTG